MLAFNGLKFVEEQRKSSTPTSACIGLVNGAFRATTFEEMEQQMDFKHRWPKEQGWMSIKETMKQITFLPQKLQRMQSSFKLK